MLISTTGREFQSQSITAATPLLPSQQAPAPLKDSILVKTISFGANGFFLASHIALNGKLLTMTGEEGAAAAALASTYLSVILGSGVGILLSTGLHIGPPIGQENYKEAGTIAKTAWALTGLVGGISSAAMFGTRGVFPLLFEEKTAQSASDFFTGYAAIGIPMLMLITSPQIAFQAGDWYIPPIASFLFFSAGGVGSYLLAFPGELGALGVGLGGALSAAATSLALQAWFLKDHYKPYQLYTSSIPGFRQKIKNLLNTGWRLSFQRLTEWGSLMLMATLIGIGGDKALRASQPAIQYTGLLASAIQSLAQAIGMIVTRNKGAIAHAQTEQNEHQAHAWHQRNVKTVVANNTAIALAMTAMTAGFYAARRPLASFFLPETIDSETQNLAETLLCISMVGLVADAVRITGAGALRGWKDILFPTVASFLTMIAIGVPLGWAMGQKLGDEATWMFHLRNATVLAAALIILDRCRKQLSSDEKSIDEFFRNIDEHNEDATTLPSAQLVIEDASSEQAPSSIYALSIDEPFEERSDIHFSTSYEQESSHRQNRLEYPRVKDMA